MSINIDYSMISQINKPADPISINSGPATTMSVAPIIACTASCQLGSSIYCKTLSTTPTMAMPSLADENHPGIVVPMKTADASLALKDNPIEESAHEMAW